MRLPEQSHLADVLADCARRLHEGIEQQSLASIDAVMKRVIDVESALRADVENALRADVDRRKRRSVATALRQWTSPRLGILRHHPPAPLQVPTSYLRTTPPRDAPSIAIVTPSYEQGRYLGRTLYSVLNQHYPRLEYFVQDGGSSDETRAVLDE